VPNELEQSTAARLIFFVGAQVIGQLLDTTGHDRDLYFR
jgi:hypothetical protein